MASITILDLAYAANDVYNDSSDSLLVNKTSSGSLKRGAYRNQLAKKHRRKKAYTPYIQSLIRRRFSDIDVKHELIKNHLGHKLRDAQTYIAKGRTDKEKMIILGKFISIYSTRSDVIKEVQGAGQQDDGMYAATYESVRDNTKVIAFRGSEFGDKMIDWRFNAQLMTTYKTQFISALKFANNVIKELGWKREDVMLCGHSLGGGLAKYVAFMWIREGHQPKATYCFNSPQLFPGPISGPLSIVLSGIKSLFGVVTRQSQATTIDLDRPIVPGDLGRCIGINMLLDPVSKMGMSISKQIDMVPNLKTDVLDDDSFSLIWNRIPILSSHRMPNVIATLKNSRRDLGERCAYTYAKRWHFPKFR